ncbi:MAG: hypothetical protein JNK85_18900 [Verrucomicrobiales bacterium]|nr:hypothetical protein [Verrucomicrobiales bacterium]
MMAPRRRESPWILLLAAAALLAAAVIHFQGTTAVARLRILPLADWRFSRTPLAFCSESNAALRGWDLRAGPIQLYFLRYTTPPGRSVKPQSETAASPSQESGTPTHLGPVLETQRSDPAFPTFENSL